MARNKITLAQGNSASTTLSASVSNTDTSFPLTSDTAFAGEGMVIIDEGLSTEEFAYATGKVGSSLTIPLANRGLEGGSAQAHAAGATVKGILTSAMYNDNAAAIKLVADAAAGTLLKATGAEINTGTEDAKIVTPKAIADSTIGKSPATASENVTGTDNAKYLTALANVPAFNNSLFSQALINGNFDVWQLGTSIAMTTANAYTADRWYCETATAGTDKTVSRQDGTGVNGSYYCARVAAVEDVDALVTFSQALESQDSIKFRGKKVTLSFYARGGTEFVADNATLVSKIVTGKGADQKVLAFTTSADGVSQNNTLTTDWQKFTCTTTAVIAADITQIGVSFAFTHAGSGTTTNYFEITQVQLCSGDVALPFMPKSYEEELRACQRYCYAVTGGGSSFAVANGSCIATTTLYALLKLPVTMRTTPAITVTATDWSVSDGQTITAATGVATVAARSGPDAVMLEVTTGATLTQYRPAHLESEGATKSIILSAEL